MFLNQANLLYSFLWTLEQLPARFYLSIKNRSVAQLFNKVEAHFAGASSGFAFSRATAG